MDITVKGLRHPHRYVLDAAQTHIYMLMKKVGGVCADGDLGPGCPSLLRYLEKSLPMGAKGDAVWLLLCWCWGTVLSTVSSTHPLARNLPEAAVLVAGWEWGDTYRCYVHPSGLSLCGNGTGIHALVMRVLPQ